MDGLVLAYGFEVVLVALLAIFMVGVIKVVFRKHLDKVEKAYRKTIYEITSMVLVVGFSALATLILGGGDINVYLTKGLATYGAMKVMYPIYENFHLRDIVQLIGKLIIGKIEGD